MCTRQVTITVHSTLTRWHFLSNMSKCPAVCPCRQTWSAAAVESTRHNVPKTAQCQLTTVFTCITILTMRITVYQLILNYM